MTQQQQEQQALTDQTLLVIPGSVELSTSTHQWDSLHPDTQYFDLQAEAHPEVEGEADSQEEEVVGSLAEEILGDICLNKEILKEDHQAIDSLATPPLSTMGTPRGPKNLWQHGNSIKELTEGRPKWTICTDDPCSFSLISRDPQRLNGFTPSAIGLSKQFKSPTNSIKDCGITPKKRSKGSLEIRYQKNEPSPN